MHGMAFSYLHFISPSFTPSFFSDNCSTRWQGHLRYTYALSWGIWPCYHSACSSVCWCSMILYLFVIHSYLQVRGIGCSINCTQVVCEYPSNCSRTCLIVSHSTQPKLSSPLYHSILTLCASLNCDHDSSLDTSSLKWWRKKKATWKRDNLWLAVKPKWWTACTHIRGGHRVELTGWVKSAVDGMHRS